MVELRNDSSEATTSNGLCDDSPDETVGEQIFEDIVVPPAIPSVATYEASGPRLMITHIENENFKSYAGRQILGPFHKCFTCIVGPNGSGKSNVIDSMLFVFGYRANKIRLKKISMLIHNSENHTDIESCCVHVHFQKIIDKPDDSFEIVPDSQFVVSRTAYRDNSSYYCINGKRTQFKEVARLLRGSGIDLDHNRFLILQGEVEQIALMKPKAPSEHEEGMLEFLEDIVGSNRFKEPIEKLAKQVEELNEQKGEKLNRVKAVEKEKDELKESRDEAVNFLKLENDICRCRNKLLHKYIKDEELNKQQAESKVSACKAELEKMDQQVTSMKVEQKEKVKKYKQLCKRLDELSSECEQLKEQFGEFEQRDTKVREDIKHTKAKGKKLVALVESEKKKLEELKCVPDIRKAEIEKLNSKKNKLEKELVTAEENLSIVMSSLVSETQSLQDKKDAKESELSELQKVVNETRSEMDIAQSALDLYLSNLTSKQTKLEEARQNLLTTVGTLKERKNEVKGWEKNLPVAEKELVSTENHLKELIHSEAKLTNDIRQNRLKLEEYRSSMSQFRSRGRVLESLIQQKEKGKIKGIFGRLGDLGAIDSKYDIAISTACGPLDNIVVDTIDTAQKCVEFLKANNIGSSTFIAIDKMQHFRQYMDNKAKTPENVPRLFDLVQISNEAIRPAFYYALRETLVAKDLDQATRVAFNGPSRNRVVTLEGALIDSSGTMSGGGNKVSKGRMGQSVVSDIEVTPKQLSKMEANLDHDLLEATKMHQQKSALEEKVEHLKASIKDMQYNLKKAKLDIDAMSKQEGILCDQVKEAENRVAAAAPDKAGLTKLEKTLAAKKKAFEKADGAASVIDTNVQKIHKEIMDITKGRTRSAQNRVDNIKSQVEQVEQSITKANVAIKTAERNLKKAADKIKSSEEELEVNKNRMEELNASLKELEVDGGKVYNERLESENKQNELQVEAAAMKKELDDLDKEMTKLQNENIDLKDRVIRVEKEANEISDKVHLWLTKIKKLKLNAIEGEGQVDLPASFTDEELHSFDTNQLMMQVTLLEENLDRMKPNMASIAEYRKKEDLYMQRCAELDKIIDLRDQRRKKHEELRKQRLDEFMTGFTVITTKLKEMYQMITLGGDAELELVDSLDPFSEGIVFSVRPPKKSWKNISNLSGGEKTLSSLALVFALHHYKPTPLYVMDEIDAALDFRNVSIVGHYIKERTKNAQFVIISLRNNMFELADRLVGIYKTDNCTKSVTINPGIINQQE